MLNSRHQAIIMNTKKRRPKRHFFVFMNSLGFDWNTLEAEVLRWKAVRANYPRVFMLSPIQAENLVNS